MTIQQIMKPVTVLALSALYIYHRQAINLMLLKGLGGLLKAGIFTVGLPFKALAALGALLWSGLTAVVLSIPTVASVVFASLPIIAGLACAFMACRLMFKLTEYLNDSIAIQWAKNSAAEQQYNHNSVRNNAEIAEMSQLWIVVRNLESQVNAQAWQLNAHEQQQHHAFQ